jgi:hypothetical protein
MWLTYDAFPFYHALFIANRLEPDFYSADKNFVSTKFGAYVLDASIAVRLSELLVQCFRIGAYMHLARSNRTTCGLFFSNLVCAYYFLPPSRRRPA